MEAHLITTTATIPVSFATTSTVQAVTAPSTGSTMEAHLITTTATIPVSFATTSTVQAVTAPSTGSTMEAHLITTTATIPVSFATTSTVQAVTAPSTGSTMEAHLITTTATIPVSFATTSTVQAVTSLAYTSTLIWSNFNTTAGGTSASVDLRSYTTIGALIQTSAPMDIRILVSPDNTFWVQDTAISFDSAGSMGWDCMRSAGYYKLWTSAAGTVTAWLVGKSA
jgi:hypothetical protein